MITTITRRIVWVLALSTAITAVVVMAGVGRADAAASGPRPVYSTAIAVDAPEGGKGGIQTPFIRCSDWRAEPKVRVDIEGLHTGETYTYRWRGAYPVMGFPRVEVGPYEVRTIATCRTNTKTWIETVRVQEKTAQRTVSRAEWRRVKRGMTADRVAHIVGYPGRGRKYRTYDMMPFWRYSIVEYRNGRVVSKLWNVDHD